MKFELCYKDKNYIIQDNYPRDNEDEIPYIWEEGNFACDCNRSQFIRDQCDPEFPDLTCGKEIKLLRVIK